MWKFISILLVGQFLDVSDVVHFTYADRRKSRLKLQRAGFHHETNSVRLIRFPGVHHQQCGTIPAQSTANEPKQPIQFNYYLSINIS